MNAPVAVRIAEFLDQAPAPVLAVVDLALKVTLLLIVALGLDLVLRRRAPLAAVTLWNALLLAVVCLPAAQHLLPRADLVRFWSSESLAGSNIAETRASAPSAAPSDTRPSTDSEPPAIAAVGQAIDFPAPSDDAPAPAASQLPPAAAANRGGPSAPDDVLPGVAAVPAAPAPRAAAAESPSLFASALRGEFGRYAWWGAAAVYGLGFVVAACRLAGALRAVARLRRTAAPLDDADWRRRFDRWVERLELEPRRVALRASDAVNVPLVVGWRSPTVIIPHEVALGASPAARDAVLVHELAHAARGDYAWQLLLKGLQTVLWFHPLIWYAERRIHYVRERVCDAFSVYKLGSAEQYAEVLLEMASRLALRCSLGLGLAVVRSSKLGERLAAVYQRGGHGRCAPSKFGRTAAAAAALAALVLIGPAAVAQVAGRAESVAVPDEARAAIEQFRAESNEQAAETTRRLRRLQEQTISRLQAVQDELTRAGKLDEAVAVREQIRALRTSASAALPPSAGSHGIPGDATGMPLSVSVAVPAHTGTLQVAPAEVTPPADPGSLTAYHLRLGEEFEFRVTGSADGSLWGTDLYTYDSTLAKAAVHAGALAIGQSGVVRVTILKGPPEFRGSSRHGVVSNPWPNASGTYTAFRVERVNDAATFVIPRSGTAPVAIPGMGSVPSQATTGYPGWPPNSFPSPTTYRTPGSSYLLGFYEKPVYTDPITPGAATSAPVIGPLLDDPGTMSGFADRRRQVFYFRVDNAAFDGAVWGTDRYTHDSDISSAAIHAGALRPGQSGILGIVVEEGPAYFSGCTRHGVESHDWDNSAGHYSAFRFVTLSFLVEASGGPHMPHDPAPRGYAPRSYGAPVEYAPSSSSATGAPKAAGTTSAPQAPYTPLVTPAAPAYRRPAYGAPPVGSPPAPASPYPTAPARPAASPSSYAPPPKLTPDTPATSAISAARGSDANPAAASSPPVEGFIRDVSDDGLVELVLRPNHAVAVGRPLGIWRNAGNDAAGNSQARFLARLRVLEAYDDRAVGRIESETRQATIERGDHVSTSLR